MIFFFSTEPKPNGGDHPDTPPQPQLATGLYETPRDALKSVRDDFSYWTGKITKTSYGLSIAIIGANWAVFGSANKLLINVWAELSIAAVIATLGISLIGYWYLGGQLRKRIAYAEEDAVRWSDEFTHNSGQATDWPITERIVRLAAIFRFVRTFLPVIGGVLFFVAVFTQHRAQTGESHSGSASPPPSGLSSPATAPPATGQPSP